MAVTYAKSGISLDGHWHRLPMLVEKNHIPVSAPVLKRLMDATVVIDMNNHDAFSCVDDERLRTGLEEMLGTLSEREQEILRYRFFSEEQMAFKEIGTRLGISGCWARTICIRTFKKLRETQHAQRLHPLLEA